MEYHLIDTDEDGMKQISQFIEGKKYDALYFYYPRTLMKYIEGSE